MYFTSLVHARRVFSMQSCFMCGLVIDSTRIKLLRYNDPLLGPRQLPNFEHTTEQKSVIEATDTFTVDTDRRVVKLKSGADCDIAVGSQLLYVVS